MSEVNVQMKRDTAANWASNNPQLLNGQRALETDTLKTKTGNGTDLYNDLPYDYVGKQTIYIPASGLLPATTNGPASAQVESTTNKVNYMVLDFDGAVAEFSHFNVAMPKSWNEGTVSFKVYWESTNTGTAGVAFKLEGHALSDGDTIDGSWGTGITVTDAAQSSAAKRYVTAESAAVTIGGSPAVGDICHFRLSRDPANGSDTMTEDARVVGLQLFYTTDANADG